MQYAGGSHAEQAQCGTEATVKNSSSIARKGQPKYKFSKEFMLTGRLQRCSDCNHAFVRLVNARSF
jgi:hypothetical protein